MPRIASENRLLADGFPSDTGREWRSHDDIQRLEGGRKGRDAEQGVRANGAICRPSDSIF